VKSKLCSAGGKQSAFYIIYYYYFRLACEQWLQQFFGCPCRLVQIDSVEKFRRQVDPYNDPRVQREAENSYTSFTDNFPLMVATKPSLQALQVWVDLAKRDTTGNRLEMSQFRPNIVLDSSRAFTDCPLRPWDEDMFKTLSFGPDRLLVDMARGDDRCIMTCINSKGVKNPSVEPLLTLRERRTMHFAGPADHSAYFGAYMCHRSTGGTIKVGDEVAQD
jgi:uncharacterized protein YcbX